MQLKRLFILITLTAALIPRLSSQVSFTGKERASDYNRGLELFEKEKYPAAIRFFDSFLKDNPGADRNLLADAALRRALASVYLFNPDAEYRVMKFIAENPDSPGINTALLDLADNFFQNRNYRKAAQYYEMVNRQELSPDDLPKYFFRYGYSLFMKGEEDMALVMFAEIKDIDTDYTAPALYYFSHIAYDRKMYLTAMDGFSKLAGDETFGAVVPFYMVQILYLQKEYDRILEIAPGLINSAGKDRSVELYRFIGDAYYNKGNYSEALPYLEKFATGTKISGREDKYQLGYCYYKTGEIDKAIKILLEITSGKDALSQNIWFLLGDCYLQKGDLKRARFGFAEASKTTYNKDIQEDALFNYAKLTYETSYSPFGEAVASFQEYIDLFPASDRIEEAYNYLVSAYMQMKNYKAAIASLDKIRNKNSRMEEAYQRVAFFRGLELLKNLELDASVDMFSKSLQYGQYNRQLRARAMYWRAEASYRLERYDDAKTDYTGFMGIPGSMFIDEYRLVRYNLGYVYFNLGDYQSALSHLKTFESGVTNVSPDILADAMNRIADCYFITTSYPQAVAYYDRVIEYGKTDADYAMFQKAFCLGLMKDEKGKADVLTSLTIKYPSSGYLPKALFERGRAFVVLGDNASGEKDFTTVINSFPENPVVPQAMVQLGLLYFNTGDNSKAVNTYKQVIENYRSTAEARYAMTGLRTTYIEMNDIESYFSYVKSLQGYGDVNLAEKDSLLYASGEKLFMEGNCEKAAPVFTNYLNEFSNGSFRINAQYYLAECLRTSGNGEEALKYYKEVAGGSLSQFSELAVRSAADISFSLENFSESYGWYSKLAEITGSNENTISALRGMLKSAYEEGDARKTIDAATKISSAGNVPEEMIREARYMKAKAHYSLNNVDASLEAFREIAGEIISSEGAESKYMVAELLYKKGQSEEAEKIIWEFIDQQSPHQYWMARVFLLLSEISVKKGDVLQAKATLMSLRDNYTIENDGILDEVKSRLDAMDQEN